MSRDSGLQVLVTFLSRLAELNDTHATGRPEPARGRTPEAWLQTAGYRRKTCQDRLSLLSDVLLVCCSWQLGLGWRRFSCRARHPAANPTAQLSPRALGLRSSMVEQDRLEGSSPFSRL